MNYNFGVYGDSIAFGYGNNNQSWFDILFKNQSIKLAQNGEKIEDVLIKIRLDNNHYNALFLAVGINDLLSNTPKNIHNIIPNLINKYREILKETLNKSSKIVVQSVLPVREELFPNQTWLDEDKWVFNSDIKIFNQNLAALCSELKVQYIDAYSKFYSKNLADIYSDAVHLNKKGQETLRTIYEEHLEPHS